MTILIICSFFYTFHVQFVFLQSSVFTRYFLFSAFSSLHCLCSDLYNLFQVVRGPTASTVKLLPQQEWRLSPPSLLLPPHPVQYSTLLLPVRQQVHLKTSQRYDNSATCSTFTLLFSLCSTSLLLESPERSLPSLHLLFPSSSQLLLCTSNTSCSQTTHSSAWICRRVIFFSNQTQQPALCPRVRYWSRRRRRRSKSFISGSQCLFTGVFLSL